MRPDRMAAVTLVMTVAAVAARGAERRLPPDYATFEERSPIGVVVSSAPEASEVGEAVLAAGGNAIDAAVATAFALGIGEPAASGLGGGSMILIHLADGRDVSIDGMVTVPSQVDVRLLRRIRRQRGEGGYEMAAVPKTVAALGLALQRYGTWRLADVLAPVIELATKGAAYTPAMVAATLGVGRGALESPQLSDYLLGPGGKIPPVTHLYAQPVLATTLKRLADHGIGEFYHGEIARQIDADMRRNGGFVRWQDLVTVRAEERRPVRGNYRGFEVVAFPWPGGGPLVIEALNILSHFPSELLAADGTDRYFLILEASRIAQLDALDISIPAPLRQLHEIDPAFGAQRAAQIHCDHIVPESELVKDLANWQDEGTTQISVVDARGNAVAITQSLGPEFGARVATAGLGFPYNGLLSSFDFENALNDAYAAPGRAPQTNAAPTIILLHGKPYLVLGSAGSGRITAAILNVLINVIDGGMSVKDAVVEPRVLWSIRRQRPEEAFEMAGPITPQIADELCDRGFEEQYRLLFPTPRPVDFLLFGNTNTVMVEPGSNWIVGVGDPRRQSAACGVPVPHAAQVGPTRRR